MTRIEDLPCLDPRQTINADVCIIGAGPAGLTIAQELASTSYSVLVLESGVQGHESAFAAGLNEIESVGFARTMDQSKVRNRSVGGSTLTWSGRCRPLDPIDFEPRPWVPLSGWPLAWEDMNPNIERASAYLGLRLLEYGDGLLDGSSKTEFNAALHGDDLCSVFWQFSRSSSLNEDYVRFGPRFRRLSADNIRLITNATVTELITTPDGSRVIEMRVCAPNRIHYRVRSRCTVLASGGIENARLMLASRRFNERGVGNEHDVVGRYLMDHPRAKLGTFPSEAQASIVKRFGLFRHSSGTVMQRGLSLTPATQRRGLLLNGAAWATQHVCDDDVWRALRMLRRSEGSARIAQGRNVLRNADQIVKGLWSRWFLGRELPRRMGPLDLDAMVEQSPDSESRLTLSSRTDALGMPLARIDWKIGEMERRTAIHLGHATNAALARVGMPSARLADWVQNNRPEDAVFIDQAHPIGATRMSNNPWSGVVDSHCRVHGVQNLFIAGSSVFPTGGHANPTLMIVAMAIRLADWLRKPGVMRESHTEIHKIENSKPLDSSSESAEVRYVLRK